MKAAINMPVFDPKVIDAAHDSNLIEVPQDIVDSLREYVADIAQSYHDNPFHNFEVRNYPFWTFLERFPIGTHFFILPDLFSMI